MPRRVQRFWSKPCVSVRARSLAITADKTDSIDCLQRFADTERNGDIRHFRRQRTI